MKSLRDILSLDRKDLKQPVSENLGKKLSRATEQLDLRLWLEDHKLREHVLPVLLKEGLHSRQQLCALQLENTLQVSAVHLSLPPSLPLSLSLSLSHPALSLTLCLSLSLTLCLSLLLLSSFHVFEHNSVINYIYEHLVNSHPSLFYYITRMWGTRD